MDGMNHGYKVSATHFLKNNVLTCNPSIQSSSMDPRELLAGIQAFDIRPLAYPNAAELRFFMDQGQGVHTGERVLGSGRTAPGLESIGNVVGAKPTLQAVGVIWRPAPKEKLKPREVPVFAYWLPYQANRTHEMMLGDKANFFFTAGLSGCTVIVTGDPRNPRVAHINRTADGGDAFQRIVVEPGMRAESMEKRRAQVTGKSFQSRMPTPTKEELTTRQMMLQELKSKVAAKQQGRTNDVLGICTWGVHYTTLASVFGVRNVGTGVWNFYRQRYASAPAVGKLQKLGLILRRDGDFEKMC